MRQEQEKVILFPPKHHLVNDAKYREVFSGQEIRKGLERTLGQRTRVFPLVRPSSPPPLPLSLALIQGLTRYPTWHDALPGFTPGLGCVSTTYPTRVSTDDCFTAFTFELSKL